MKNIFKQIKNRHKWFNSELIFYIAVALLPFENFFFAPSAGWATLTPLVLALYILLNFKSIWKTFLKVKNIVIFFIAAIILGSATAFLNGVNTSDFINSFVPLILGATSLFAFFLFYEKKKDLSRVVNIIVISYAVCAVIGFFEFLAIKTNNYPVAEFIEKIFKRDYLHLDRVQFFFTEPSFIGMHLFGVLLPIYWLSRRKDLLFIIGLFIVEAIAFQSGIRIIVDIALVAVLYFTYLIFKKGKAAYIPLILLTIIVGFSYAYSSNARFKKIVDGGIYSDGSFASRYFRVQSSIIGYAKTPGQALIGYGLGNSMKPIRLGYDEAYEQYTSTYVREVDSLGNITYHDDSASYSLYTRMVSEFGLVLTIFALIYLVIITKNSRLPQKWLYLSVILYIYVQFESLGFYAIWLFIATMYFTNEKRITNKTLLARISDNVFRRRK